MVLSRDEKADEGQSFVYNITTQQTDRQTDRRTFRRIYRGTRFSYGVAGQYFARYWRFFPATLLVRRFPFLHFSAHLRASTYPLT